MGRKPKVLLAPDLQEQMFQEAMKAWESTGEIEYWHKMWLRVLECCRALALRIAPGKPLTEERSVDAAIKVMDRIERLGKRPEKLSSYCYWPVRESLQGKQQVHEDQEQQLHEEFKEETRREEIRGICRIELMTTRD